PVCHDGVSIIWNLYGIGQYIPSFLIIGQYLRDFLTGLLHGALVLPVWDLSIAMGEDIVGALNYYGFGDPINLLAIFATRANGVYVYMFCFFLRLWLAGQTFRLYCREVGMEYRASLAAALSYAFCGFAVYGGGRYIEWLSVLIYFPLLLIGAERIMKDRQKPWILTLTVAYAARCGFYFLYMSCLCLGVYCAVRLVSIYGWKPFRRLLRKCLTLLRHFIPGLLLAAPVFLPAVSAYLNSERLTQGGSVTDILFSLSSYIPSLNRSLLYAVFDLFHDQRQLLSGILLVELLALVLLFTIRSRKALQLKIAVLTALIALHLPISGWVFNAFGETNERWCFWVHFVFALSFAYVLTVFPSTEISTSWSDIRFIGR
ncbi:MAG: YfhO family protein, partial [Lachnospiraceae bacterium]|nr:YfhO family protein [Lachnospiraceae bacterium]